MRVDNRTVMVGHFVTEQNIFECNEQSVHVCFVCHVLALEVNMSNVDVNL